MGIPYLVTHPGAHVGSGKEAGLSRVAAGLDRAYAAAGDAKVVTCLEITAGQGSSLGYKLEHLAEIISRSKEQRRFGVCLDTAHLFAAGYDFRGRRYAKFRKDLDAIVGISRVKVLHLNDSKKDLGSRVDRHEHIGFGKIGKAGFIPFVRDEAFLETPKILETPKDKHPSGRPWDEVNLQTLLDARVKFITLLICRALPNRKSKSFDRSWSITIISTTSRASRRSAIGNSTG